MELIPTFLIMAPTCPKNNGNAQTKGGSIFFPARSVAKKTKHALTSRIGKLLKNLRMKRSRRDWNNNIKNYVGGIAEPVQ